MRKDVHEFLVKIAKKRKTTTYETIAGKFDIFIARVGQEVGEISTYEKANGRPLLSSLVVNATGYPGGGFFGLAHLPKSVRRRSDRYKDQELNGAEMRFVDNEQKRAWKYWKNVIPCYID